MEEENEQNRNLIAKSEGLEQEREQLEQEREQLEQEREQLEQETMVNSEKALAHWEEEKWKSIVSQTRTARG